MSHLNLSWLRLLALGAILSPLALLVSGNGASSGELSAGDHHWRVATAPALQGSFSDVAVIRPGELWAVGTAQAGQQSHGVIAHRSGGRWEVRAFPVGSTVTSVAARPEVAWAVGSAAGGGPMILRGMGGSWQLVAAAPARSHLYGVALSSASNVWIGGSVLDGGTRHPLALHFDGSRWQQFVLPSAGAAFGVDTLDADRTWIVGADDATTTAAIWRWNGTGWSQAHVPAQVSGDSAMTNVAARRGHTVWAVGGADGGGCCATDPVAVRLTPHGWRSMNPPLGIQSNDVAVGGPPLHPTLVGEFYTGTSQEPGVRVPRIRSWTGTSWIADVIDGLVQPPATDSALEAVDVDGQGGQWAVGYLGSDVLVVHRQLPPRD